MKKIGLFLIVLLLPTFILAQKTITVVSNIKVTYDQKRGSYRWYRPVFAHEGSTLAADSSDFNEGDNFFDAYGHVVITQPNGTVVYADKLHYTESNQQALLTGNVRLVDQTSTLTTNYLTYNMKSKIGTYHGGGRIINGTDTLDSKNGYYFENTQDAYFRHNVVVRTPDALINTDTMRYNSNSKMTYFYGPTNIFGKNGTLYTENGDYNTQSDRARFGKNNLYTEGSKFLRGDSLYYDGASGNGRAVKNVFFIDTAQKIVMRGQLGTYHKETQTTVVTQNAYIVLATEDSTANSTDTTTSVLQDSTEIDYSIRKDSLSGPTEHKMDSTFMTADTLFSQVIPLRDYSFIELKLGKENDDLEDEVDEPDGSADLNQDNMIGRAPSISNDSLEISDSLAVNQLDSLGNPVDSLNINSFARDSLTNDSLNINSLARDSLSIQDSVSLSKDSLDNLEKKPGLTKKEKKELKKQEKLERKKEKQQQKEEKKKEKEDKRKAKEEDTNKDEKELSDSLKSSVNDSLTTIATPPLVPDSLHTDSLDLELDSTFNAPTKGMADSLLHEATKTALQSKTDSLSSDTTETRIVKAYHNVKIFKSNLQAIADSAYYGYADSIIRCYGKPIIWSQGSQLSADTVYMILKDQKMENILFDRNAFIVNTELDSVKFNQVKGRKITGYFKNSDLDRIYVDGNAESVYYTVEEDEYTGMLRSISSRIKILFENNQMTDVISIRKAENKYYPLAIAPADQEILEGFIWKPELRPKSNEEIINAKPTVAPKEQALGTEVLPREQSSLQDTTLQDTTTIKEEISTNEADSLTSASEIKEDISPETNDKVDATKEAEKTDNDSTNSGELEKKSSINNNEKRENGPAINEREELEEQQPDEKDKQPEEQEINTSTGNPPTS